MLTPEQIAAKWAQRTGAATQDYVEGVQAVTEAPGAKAARKVEKYKQGLTDNVGKWARNVAGVSLEEWKAATAEKGGQRYAAGAAAGESKMAAFQREFQPHLQQGLAKINAMPDTTLEQRIAKAAELARHNAKFRKSS